MRRRGWVVPAALLLALSWTWSVAAPQRPARTGGQAPRFESVTFSIRHRVFHDFRDVQTVKLNQDFPLGESEFSGRVVQYVPDFQMDLSTRKVFSLSNQPRNPAFKVIVSKQKVPQDTTWAFLKSPPHFGARSYFAFLVLQIDFANRTPLMADTAAVSRGAVYTRPASKDSTKAP